jgi:hypothetical protein
MLVQDARNDTDDRDKLAAHQGVICREGGTMAVNRQEACETALRQGAAWLIEQAQIPAGGRASAPFDDPLSYPHGNYTGAIRTEYDTKTRRWGVNGPTWHAGQAIIAILVAERRLGEARYRDAALAAGAFVLRERLTAPAEVAGMLLTYEGDSVHVNVEVGFEGISGLLDLHSATGERRWLDAAQAAADALLGGYLPEEGLARDHYHVGRGEFVGDPENPNPGRAMLDDATLAKLAVATGDERYADLFLTMADRLLRRGNRKLGASTGGNRGGGAGRFWPPTIWHRHAAMPTPSDSLRGRPAPQSGIYRGRISMAGPITRRIRRGNTTATACVRPSARSRSSFGPISGGAPATRAGSRRFGARLVTCCAPSSHPMLRTSMCAVRSSRARISLMAASRPDSRSAISLRSSGSAPSIRSSIFQSCSPQRVRNGPIRR